MCINVSRMCYFSLCWKLQTKTVKQKYFCYTLLPRAIILVRDLCSTSQTLLTGKYLLSCAAAPGVRVWCLSTEFHAVFFKYFWKDCLMSNLVEAFTNFNAIIWVFTEEQDIQTSKKPQRISLNITSILTDLGIISLGMLMYSDGTF